MTRTGSAKDHQREAWLAALDPGVAPYVDVLDSAGVETYESCEGGDGHSYPEPAVRFYGVRGEGFRALAVALQNGLPVRAIRRLWMVDEDGHPHGPYWEMAWRAQRPWIARVLQRSHGGRPPSPEMRCSCLMSLRNPQAELSW